LKPQEKLHEKPQENEQQSGAEAPPVVNAAARTKLYMKTTSSPLEWFAPVAWFT
jgi:hypothetical protein